MRTIRHRAALVAAAAGALLAASACGTSGPGERPAGEIKIWALQGDAVNKVEKATVDSLNSSAGSQARLEFFLNDPYKQKLQVAMGSPNAPDVFFNWGGGNLKQYVDAGQVADLTPELNKDPKFRDSFLPVVMKTAELNGKTYGIPTRGMQPITLFYNKDVFADAGAQPPKTWADLLKLVDTFKAKNVTPLALAGSQGWTELMYIEYLLDRVGGPEKFQAIEEGKPGAWQDPAMIESLGMIQELVDRGAFGTKFASVDYDVGGASTLFAKGKAAMHLMGSWEYATQIGQNPEFVKNGKMGWVAFPSVPGGKGDPKNIVGNPANFFSVSSASKDKATATKFLKTMNSDAYIDGMIGVGEVPAIKGLEAKLQSGPDASYTSFTYDMVKNAPNFTQSWDQALTPSVSEALLTNLQKLFLKEISPEQFAKAMESAK